MRSDRRVIQALALALVTTLTAACEASSAPVASTAPTDTPVRGGRLVLASANDQDTLQPILANDDLGGAIRLIYWPMLENDPATGELSPGLAQGFTSTADGKTITFTLRDGVSWSDGVPFTGEDYKYTVEAYARSKKTFRKSKFLDITGWSDYAQGRDDSLRGVRVGGGGRVIEISLDRSSCLSLRNLNLSPLPRHDFITYWDNRTLDVTTSIDSSPFNRAPPAATGPFVFKEWRPNDQITVTRNDRYFRGPPLLDEVVLKVLPLPSATKIAFVVGDTHWFTPQSADVEYVRQQMGSSAHEYLVKDKLGYNFVAWNQKATRAPWLADKRVRQALWYGLDVKTIVSKLEFGFGHPVYANTPEASWAYDGTGLNHYDYDPARARALLEAAGATMGPDGIYRWSNGQPMEIRVETNSSNATRVSIVQIAQEQYKQIGIRIVPVIEAFNLLVQRVTPSDGTVEGVLLGWAFAQPDPEPDAYMIWHSSMQGKDGNNFVGMSSKELDAALDAGRYGPDCSTSARKRAYQTVDRILNEEAPYTFLYVTDSVFFVSNKLVRPAPQPFGVWLDVEKWWIRP